MVRTRTYAFAPLLGGLVFWATAVAGLGRAQSPTYSVSPILLPAGLSATCAGQFVLMPCYGINVLGQVVGYVVNGLGQDQAFIGTAAGTTLIPLPAGWSYSVANGINDGGQVVGVGGPEQGGQAFVGTPAGVTPIQLPQGWMATTATAINDYSQVAGWGYNATGGVQAFIGTATGITPIPLQGWTQSYALGINNSGQIVGWGYNATGGAQAFIGTAAGITPIPLPQGWTQSYAFGINDLGQIVGWGYNGAGAAQAFIVTAAGITPIPLQGWTQSYAYSINDSGQIAGWGSDATGLDHAFVGTLTGITPIQPPAGWLLQFGLGVNEAGQVVGYGENVSMDFLGVVVMTPGSAQGVDLSQERPTTWQPLLSMLTDAAGATTDSKGNPIGPLQFVISDAYSGAGGTIFPANDILSSYQNAADPMGGTPLMAAYVYLGFCPDCYIWTDTGADQVQTALESVCGGQGSKLPCPLELSLGFLAVDVECVNGGGGNQCGNWTNASADLVSIAAISRSANVVTVSCGSSNCNVDARDGFCISGVTGDPTLNVCSEAVAGNGTSFKFDLTGANESFNSQGSVLPPIAANNEKIYQAVQAVEAAGLKPIIYSDSEPWSALTGGNVGTSSFSCIPLWRPRYDNVAELNFSGAFGGWQQAVGKQFQQLCHPPNTTNCPDAPELSTSDTPSLDLDVFADLSYFTPGVSCAANPVGCMAQDVSSSVAVVRGGYHYNQGTHYFDENMTVTNKAVCPASGSASYNPACPVASPVSLVLDPLLASYQFTIDGSGSTSCTYPAGSPYANISSQPLASGQQPISVHFHFVPNPVGPQYTTRVLSGGGVR